MDASIVIPTYNREAALIQTLQALARVDYPKTRWEAIVVDDGSAEDIQAAVTGFARSTGALVRFLSQENAGPAAARNRGAAAASGDALIFIDNDILVQPSFVRHHLASLFANPGCWIMGRVIHPPELLRTPFGRYRDSVWEAFHQSTGGGGIKQTSGITAANLSLPARDFHRLGGFDESFSIASCEDFDLGIRARRAGIRVLYDPEIIVEHNDWAVSLDKFCERQRMYSISDVLFWRKYGDDSPRAHLVLQNSPIDWANDSLSLVLKKTARQLLASSPVSGVVRGAAGIAERIAPDTALCRRAYQLAIGCAILRGVREGLTRYPAAAPERPPIATCERA